MVEAKDIGGAVVSLRLKRSEGQIKGALTPTLRKLQCELQEYFSGKRDSFSVPFRISGSEFQCRVWNALCRIPHGKTVTYGDLAKMIGKPKAARAVGGALNQNPIMILVPCHRVTGKDSVGGFAVGLKAKRALLAVENVIS